VWGKRPYVSITRPDVVELIEGIIAKGHNTQGWSAHGQQRISKCAGTLTPASWWLTTVGSKAVRTPIAVSVLLMFCADVRAQTATEEG
jgi:hypothetical protein